MQWGARLLRGHLPLKSLARPRSFAAWGSSAPCRACPSITAARVELFPALTLRHLADAIACRCL